MSHDLSLFFSNMGTRAYATLTRGPFCGQDIEEKAIDDKITKATTELAKPENERDLSTIKDHLQEAVVLTDALHRSKFRNINYLKICKVYAQISASKEMMGLASKMQETGRTIPKEDLQELPGFFDAFKSETTINYGRGTLLYAGMIEFTQLIKNKEFTKANKVADIVSRICTLSAVPFYLELARNLAQDPTEKNLDTIQTLNKKIQSINIKIPLCTSELTALKKAFPFLADALESGTTYQTAIHLYEFSTALQSENKHQATNIALKFSPSLQERLLKKVCIQHAEDGNDVSAISELLKKIKDLGILQETYQTVLSTYVEKGYSKEKIQELNKLVNEESAGFSKLILLQDLLKKGDIEKARQLAETLPDTKVDYDYRSNRPFAQQKGLPEQYLSVDADGNRTPIYTYKELASLLIDLAAIAQSKTITIDGRYSPEAKFFAVKELCKASTYTSIPQIASTLEEAQKIELYGEVFKKLNEDQIKVLWLLIQKNIPALKMIEKLIENKEIPAAKILINSIKLSNEDPNYANLKAIAIAFAQKGFSEEANEIANFVAEKDASLGVTFYQAIRTTA